MDERRVPSRVRVPRGLAERAREFAAGGLSPAVPRDAATVILLRQDPQVAQNPGLEAFLLRRTKALEFAPGACVFPGGSVDERDADPVIGETAWAGPSPADLGGQLGISADRVRGLVCAAVRETFEESGVLLAGPSPTDLVRHSAALMQDRRDLLDGSVSLGELLGRRGLVLRADLLTPWARWITPEVSPRRYDTWFFAAAMPPGQTAALPQGTGGAALPRGAEGVWGETRGVRGAEGVWGERLPPRIGGVPGGVVPPGDNTESDSGTWLAPSAALEAARAGQITLLPPTAVTLAELAAYRDVAGVLAERRVITPLLPKVVVEGERAWLAMPQATEYPS
jgi:8-oxo-dGTP pyrophosphatase MutT (NUDIX family)